MLKASLYHLANKILRRFVPLMTGMLFSASLPAQDFDYSFTKDSVEWQELNAQTILNENNSAWKFCYKIPIGFSFNYLGRNFDSLCIETNGYLVFDDDRNYALTVFPGFGDCIDSTGNHSVLGYTLTGPNGNRILKIQHKNIGSIYSTNQFITYQTWLYEAGNKIEIRMGPGNFNVPDHTNDVLSVLNNLELPEGGNPVSLDSLHLDGGPGFRIGLLNMNMDTPTCGYFINGDPSNPEGQQLNVQHAIGTLTKIPGAGMKYTLQPAFN